MSGLRLEASKKEYGSVFYVAHGRCAIVCAMYFAANNLEPWPVILPK
jgi:hypothetical protein